METTTAPALSATTTTPRAPLSGRYVWVAVLVAAALPVIIFAVIITLLVTANVNFLEWME